MDEQDDTKWAGAKAAPKNEPAVAKWIGLGVGAGIGSAAIRRGVALCLAQEGQGRVLTLA